MPARDRKASTISPQIDLAEMDPEEARELLAAALDPDRGRCTVARHNSPIAAAYGPSKKPVCHFLAGWMAGIGRLLVGKELLCEEISCAAQGHDQCEFELQPMPMA